MANNNDEKIGYRHTFGAQTPNDVLRLKHSFGVKPVIEPPHLVFDLTQGKVEVPPYELCECTFSLKFAVDDDQNHIAGEITDVVSEKLIECGFAFAKVTIWQHRVEFVTLLIDGQPKVQTVYCFYGKATSYP